MIKPSSNGVSSLGISPVRGNSKHAGTPLKFRRKTSRKDQATDVHTACSTPNRFHSENPVASNSLDSPSDSFPCSQDNRPDVIWDYTSPKLPKGAKKREIKITVEEFLKSINHNQHSECNTQNSHYIRLLEKWMAKQNTPVCVKKPAKVVKRDYKMRSRRVFEDMKQFMESMQTKNEDKVAQDVSSRENNIAENSLPNVEHITKSSPSVDKQSFLDGDNENDSLEELWGEADNSFIVKATQNLEVSSLRYNNQGQNAEIMSTVPETIPNTKVSNNVNSEIHQTAQKDTLNKCVLDSDYQAQVLFTQIMSYDWESDSDFEDFENGFIMGDDDLSLIPDEVLSGTTNEQDKITETKSQDALKLSSNSTLKSTKLNSCSSENRSCEISFGCSESNNISEADVLSEIELFNNFEDESFGDESILCKPEVLSWIDEVENKLSQSQKSSSDSSQNTKCTPKEIERKKDEAIQRLRKKQQQKK